MRALSCAAVLTALVASLAGVRAHAQSGGATPDSLKRIAIRRLLVIQRTDTLMLTGIEQAFAQTPASPDMPAGFVDSLRSRARRDIHLFVESLVPIYDSLYSASEIEELGTFYQSKIGQRYLAVQPRLMEALQELGRRWGMQLAAQVILDLSRQPASRP